MNTHLPFSAIVLAGGKGTRIPGNLPKQYRSLGNKPLVMHSIDTFLACHELHQLAIVCAHNQRHLFPTDDPRVLFAPPGERRQDSVYSGLQVLDKSTQTVVIHDGARPFIDLEMIRRTVTGAHQNGAATTAMPITSTVKQSADGAQIDKTLERSQLYEAQTPQAVQRHILESAFEVIHRDNLTVTDDVALAELVGASPLLVAGSRHNLKVTLPEDFAIAEALLKVPTRHE